MLRSSTPPPHLKRNLICLQISYPTVASVSHSIINGYNFCSCYPAVIEAAAPAEQLQPKKKSKNKSDEDMGFGLLSNHLL
uniref:Uncharacterized protein n=1 Tax=Naja naja TaxID=35670 RepID=A0A8C6VD70_NAJNA